MRGTPHRKALVSSAAFRLGAALLGASIAACSAVNTYSTGGPTSNVDLRRVVRDSNLASDIVIEAAKSSMVGRNRVAQLTVRNAGSSTRNIAVQYVWFDAQGINITGSQPVWMDYTLMPGETRELSSVGGQDAEDFRVSVASR
jgi:uncharacterized protein YcfL